MRSPFAIACCLPALAVAQDVDFDAVDEADALVAAAQAAADAGDWPTARRLAEEALALDDSAATAAVRLVLVRALAAEGATESAQYELRQYLALPLDDADRLAGQALEASLDATARKESRAAARVRSGAWRRDGIGLIVGGLAPVGVGAWFIGTDARWAWQGQPSGTWALIGAPTLAAGVALEIAGIACLADPQVRAMRRTLGLALVPGRDGAQLTVGGRF